MPESIGDLERLADLVAERVAARVAALFSTKSEPPTRLTWTCSEVAEAIGRSADFVRDHRDELGVLPAEGERPRLLFDPERVRAWATARDAVVRSGPRDPAPARANRREAPPVLSSAPSLLPIRPARRAA